MHSFLFPKYFVKTKETPKFTIEISKKYENLFVPPVKIAL